MPASTTPAHDPVALTRALIRCPSVTPVDAGALDVLQGVLEPMGFRCHRLTFEEAGTEPVENLYARWGEAQPNFCFAGHTDVVPVGNRDGWSRDPFAAEVVEDRLFGRGAVDMKGAIACFVAAAAGLLEKAPPKGSISLLITGDEEGPSINGTRKVLAWMAEQGEVIDHCIVGEPTNPATLGEMVKIGRRGSLNARITVEGVQGHVAYPHLADNPVPRLVRLLAALDGLVLDEGNAHFQPSNLEITSVDVGNTATNVIPARATAAFNVRFNDMHSSESLTALLRKTLDGTGEPYALSVQVSGESFLTPPGRLSDILGAVIGEVIGGTPELSTTGGTSDARFIKDFAPVAEFGLVSQTMHKIDECVPVADLTKLTAIYRAVLERYFDPQC
ncbi:MAG: succinyl-diaminopimelate desuccinylase [Rhodospirillaceae bacterium]|nr:succinyl-diaminopimelate desuccinylase [Rhodospirillaceae bacterium]